MRSINTLDGLVHNAGAMFSQRREVDVAGRHHIRPVVALPRESLLPDTDPTGRLPEVGDRVDAVAQPKALLQPAAQMAAAAFGEQRVLAVQLHAGLIRIGLVAFAVDAHVAGDHAFHDAALVVEHVGRGKTRKDLDSERFGLLTQPAAQRRSRCSKPMPAGEPKCSSWINNIPKSWPNMTLRATRGMPAITAR